MLNPHDVKPVGRGNARNLAEANLLANQKTAQKPTKSLSSDSFKRFKEALVRTAKIDIIRQDEEIMANHQQQKQKQQTATDAAAMTRLHIWADSNHGEGSGTVIGEVVECGGLARPTRVEPDSQEERMSAMVVAQVNSSSSGATEYGKAKGVTTAMVLPAVPVSPPSSPTRVSAQLEAATNNPKLEASVASMATVESAEATSPIAEADSESNLKTKANQSAVKLQHSSVGGGVPAAPSAVKIPPLSTMSDGKDLVESSATASARAGTTTAPLRLGRGRKLCPNCKATTKSAVKQCRECKHVFSPASSRLRVPPRETKEDEDEPMPARRRLRPSQRLIEYELYEASASAADEGNGLPARSTTRRPLSASNGGGSANRSVDSSASGGRPAVSDGEVSKKLASTGGVDGPAPPPKRSHKRKVPLPPGVLPPKRKKGTAAAARAVVNATAATAENAAETTDGASTENAQHFLPLTSLPERRRIAQDLVAAPTSAVPMSPELIPAATPAGPLLFMPSNPSPDDDSGWLSIPVSMTSLTVQLPQLSNGCLTRTPRAEQAHHGLASQATVASTSSALLGASVEDLLMGGEKGEEPELCWRSEDVIDTSLESQCKDPFEGVQLCLEGASERGSDRCVSGCLTSAGAATATHGAAPELSQHMLLNNDVDLLGDGEADLLWSPLRTSSANESIGSLASSISNMSLWSDGSDPSRSSSDVAFPNFERGAALASAVALNGGGVGNFETELTRSESVGDLQGHLLGDPNLESLTDVCRQ